VAASVVQGGEDRVSDEEDRAAAAVAAYIVLLGAHARGLGGYWRTPAVLRTPEGRAACGVPDGEDVIGLLHLGRARGEKPAPDRAPVETIREYLD
jgi:nitroreductase